MAVSEKIEFTAADKGEKSFEYTLKNSMTSAVRVYIETEGGTTAVVKNVKLLRSLPA